MLAVELNFKNEARGWSEAATMCGLTTRNKDRANMSEEQTLLLKHNHKGTNGYPKEAKRFNAGMVIAIAWHAERMQSCSWRCQVAFDCITANC